MDHMNFETVFWEHLDFLIQANFLFSMAHSWRIPKYILKLSGSLTVWRRKLNKITCAYDCAGPAVKKVRMTPHRETDDRKGDYLSSGQPCYLWPIYESSQNEGRAPWAELPVQITAKNTRFSAIPFHPCHSRPKIQPFYHIRLRDCIHWIDTAQTVLSKQSYPWLYSGRSFD